MITTLSIQRVFWLAAAACALVLVLLAPLAARAESVQWSQVVSGDFSSEYKNNAPNGRVHLQMTLSNPAITVTYRGAAFEVNGSGDKIRQLQSGATLAAGTRVLFEFGSHDNSDIAWNASGSANGTPYGFWTSDAADPGGSSCNSVEQYASNISILDKHWNSSGGMSNLFAAYAVNPPAKSVSTSGVWSGCVSSGGSNMICTVGNSGGQVSGTMTFAGTHSRFYGDMTFRFTNLNFINNSGGVNSGCLNMNTLGSAINVGQESIQFNFTATAAPNDPPAAPVLSGGACVVGSAWTITMKGTDPNGDRIKYAIDWDANGMIDQVVPSSGYITSGTQRDATRTYSTVGGKIVRVKTIDEKDSESAWAEIVFDCTEEQEPEEPEPSSCPVGQTLINGVCSPTVCPGGQVLTGDTCACPVGYSLQGGICKRLCPGGQVLIGDTCACPEGQTLQGGMCRLECPTGQVPVGGSCGCPNGQQLIDGMCIGGTSQCTQIMYCQGDDLYRQKNNCSTELVDQCSFGCSYGACNPAPDPTVTITATPALVGTLETSQISWSATNVVPASCKVTGNGDSWTGQSGTKTSSPIATQVTYTFSCRGLNGSTATDSVTINIIPVFCEPGDQGCTTQ